MDGNMSYFEHLNPKDVEDYNETVKCFKDFEPAIAIIETGDASQGFYSKWLFYTFKTIDMITTVLSM